MFILNFFGDVSGWMSSIGTLTVWFRVLGFRVYGWGFKVRVRVRVCTPASNLPAKQSVDTYFYIYPGSYVM